MNRHVVERTSEVPLSVGKLDGVGHEDPRLGLRTATRERAALTTSRRRWRLRGSTSTDAVDASPQTVRSKRIPRTPGRTWAWSHVSSVVAPFTSSQGARVGTSATTGM